MLCGKGLQTDLAEQLNRLLQRGWPQGDMP